jgi:hypothetical protein
MDLDKIDHVTRHSNLITKTVILSQSACAYYFCDSSRRTQKPTSMSALLCTHGVLLRSNDANPMINAKDHILGVKKFYTSSCFVRWLNYEWPLCSHFEVWIVANRLESLEKWWACVVDAMTINNWEGPLNPSCHSKIYLIVFQFFLLMGIFNLSNEK